ncbi:MAG: alpha,alpha-trehalose-phosphate synthase (UDP-forming) [Candidatus Aminicenantia bacterium]
MVWDKETLRGMVKEKFGEHKFIIVSNREPYMHIYTEEGIKCVTPASGMAIALDSVMKTSCGIWIASGSGDADREVVDEKDRIKVPPENPSYTLRRIWLTNEEEEGFYYSYSNEGLWPLCHNAYVRPNFREEDWKIYKKVNEKFADVVVEEMGDDAGFIFIQDYHFALLPKILKERLPNAIIAQFWHIPWPNPDSFKVCPHGEEILEGLLGNDLLGFHIRYYCLNFLDTVDRFLEARIDREKLAVIKGGRETLLRPYPISVDFEEIEKIAASKRAEEKVSNIRKDFRIKDRILGVGVDRIDYTKGIVERFMAIDRFLEKYPEYIGKFVFLQLGPISRIKILKYKEYNDEIYHKMVDINSRWKFKDWQPIILQKSNYGKEDVIAYYRASDLCIVSSIHDGMNLVAKEFVASKVDGKGVLILSKFTGASRELTEAVLVNPIAIDHFANAIKFAIEMKEDEKVERLNKMREIIRENNIYRWAGKIIGDLKKLM